jgi:hypothetical protein
MWFEFITALRVRRILSILMLKSCVCVISTVCDRVKRRIGATTGLPWHRHRRQAHLWLMCGLEELRNWLLIWVEISRSPPCISVVEDSEKIMPKVIVTADGIRDDRECLPL